MNLKNIVAVWLIFILNIGLCFEAQSETRTILDKIIAIVNNDVITYQDIKEEIALYKCELGTNKNILTRNENFPFSEKQILDRIITRTLQSQLVKNSGIIIDQYLVDIEISNLFNKNNKINNLTSLKKHLYNCGTSFNKLSEIISSNLAINLLKQKLISSYQFDISDEEIRDLYENKLFSTNDLSTQYHILHIFLPVTEQMSKEYIIKLYNYSNNFIKKLYTGQNNKLDESIFVANDMGWRSVNYLPNLFTQSLKKLKVGEYSEVLKSPNGFHIIKLLGTRNINNITSEVHIKYIMVKEAFSSDLIAAKQIEKIYELTLLGKDFSELAKKYSDDQSYAKGGDLGWIYLNTLDLEFIKIISNLSNNEISKPFKTNLGWHIIQLVEKRSRPIENLDPIVKQKLIYGFLLQQHIDAEWQELLSQLRSQAYVEKQESNF